jgi:hypothetical protein
MRPNDDVPATAGTHNTRIYCYAIGAREASATGGPGPSLEGLTGFDGRRLQLREILAEDLVAFVTAVDRSAVQANKENLLRHEAVVEALMVHRTILPVRFGTVFTGDSVVHARLLHYGDQFRADLGRVAGCVEVSVRALWCVSEEIGPGASAALFGADEDLAPAAPGRGRRYLMARLAMEKEHLARRARAETLAAELHRPLAGLAVAATQQILTTPRILLTGAYLVRHDDLPAFQLMLKAVDAAHLSVSMLCTGPWPPYSFVTVSGAAGETMPLTQKEEP